MQKINIPTSQAGLVRYSEDQSSNIGIKPGYVIVLVLLVIILEIVIHALF